MKSNIEIVKNYLEGTRPYTIVQGGFQGEPTVTRNIGDTWSDHNGWIYEKKHGYVIKQTRLGKLINSDRQKICCDCKIDVRWGDKKDENYFNSDGRCYNCTLIFESRLRVQGKFKDYQTKKVLLSQRSLISNIKKELEEAIEFATKEKVITFVNSTGLVETWENTNREKSIEFMNKDLDICKTQLAEIEEKLKVLNV